MKARQHNTLRLGLFVAIGLFILLLAIFLIGKQQRLFGNTFKLIAYYKSVEGLMIGNNVRFSGIDVGTVDDIIILNDTIVQVTLVIEEKTRRFIKKDSRASIGTNGLMGDRIVNILPGSPGAKGVEDGNVIPAIEPFTINELLDPLKQTAINAREISNDMAAISSNIRKGKGTIGRLFTDESLANNISSTMNNVSNASGKLNENIEAMRGNIFFRRYFRKKAREEEKRQLEEERKKKAQQDSIRARKK